MGKGDNDTRSESNPQSFTGESSTGIGSTLSPALTNVGRDVQLAQTPKGPAITGSNNIRNLDGSIHGYDASDVVSIVQAIGGGTAQIIGDTAAAVKQTQQESNSALLQASGNQNELSRFVSGNATVIIAAMVVGGYMWVKGRK